MARWLITGANRDTAENVVFTFNATSAAEAEQQASRRNILVERVESLNNAAGSHRFLFLVVAFIAMSTAIFALIEVANLKRQIMVIKAEVSENREKQNRKSPPSTNESSSRALSVATTVLTPLVKPLDFAWNDPIGSFTVVNAGRLRGNDFYVDSEKWALLPPIQQKRVADAIWNQMVIATKNSGEAEASIIEIKGKTQGSKQIREGYTGGGQLTMIDAQEKAELRRVKIDEDVSKAVVRIIDVSSKSVLAQRTVSGFVAK